MAQVARRVAEAQLAGELGTYDLTQDGRQEMLHASFPRKGYTCRYRFASLGAGPMVLEEASIVSDFDGEQYMAWTVTVGMQSLNVTMAFDEKRAYSIRCDRQGVVSGIALPFGLEQMRALPRAAIWSYRLEASILASWSILSALVLCRYREDNLTEILSIQTGLRADAERLFRDAVRQFDLRIGVGKTGISFPSWRMDGVEA